MNKQARTIIDKFAVSTSKVLHEAARFGESNKCRVCGRKDWNVVPLYEYGDQRQPSQVVLFCRNCKHNEPFAVVPYKEAISYAEHVMNQKRVEQYAKEDQGFTTVGTERAGEHIDFNWKQKAQKLWKERPAFRKFWKNLNNK